MERKTIIFTVDRDSISPRTEQKAGVQGNHNITEVRFEGDSVLSNAMENSKNYKVRMQFIDGAGGFYSSGFLTVYSDETDDRLFVTCPIPNNVTNAGGLAYVYLVVTEIAYESEKALEKQVYISPPGKLLYTHSGVGSPSEYAYKVGITNALVNAEIFVGQAEAASKEAEDAKNQAAQTGNYVIELSEKIQKNATAAATSAANALTSENNAKDSENAADESAINAQESENRASAYADKAGTSETNARTSATNASHSADTATSSATTAREASAWARKYRDETATMFDNFNGIQLWQPNTEYKVGDYCLWSTYVDEAYKVTYLMYCIENHTSSSNLMSNIQCWEQYDIKVTYAIKDAFGKVIHETYATKDELAEAIGEALEGDY